MANDDKERPLAVIIGERLKLFRQERGLRQADVAAAAAEWGLPWARSSVAALEGGSRNLSIEEALMLPLVMGELGGWDKPLVPDDADIALTSKSGIQGMYIPVLANGLTSETASLTEKSPLSESSYGIRGATQEDASPDQDLYSYQRHAEETAWKLFCSRVYPELNFRDVAHGMNLGKDLELVAKVAKRLTLPNDGPPSWGIVNVLSRALWGQSLEAERDERAAQREGLQGRALQSAKGHITRDLTAELEAEALRVWPELDGVFGQLATIWNDPEQLREWTVNASVRGGLELRQRRREGQVQRFNVEQSKAAKALEDIGASLRAARLTAGMSIDDVAESIMARPRAVEEIESGEYLKGKKVEQVEAYLRAFARAVGVSPDEIGRSYSASLADGSA
ncbi:helix-turn-helix domain-containing protein [Streptomyces sp. NPDC018693]|uniref:helix-turn-helix domain-containing protein n=1 Tax=unclassified Streptomyces TaxID=2593676 RepID=UPI0037A0D6D4